MVWPGDEKNESIGGIWNPGPRIASSTAVNAPEISSRGNAWLTAASSVAALGAGIKPIELSHGVALAVSAPLAHTNWKAPIWRVAPIDVVFKSNASEVFEASASAEVRSPACPPETYNSTGKPEVSKTHGPAPVNPAIPPFNAALSR